MKRLVKSILLAGCFLLAGGFPSAHATEQTTVAFNSNTSFTACENEADAHRAAERASGAEDAPLFNLGTCTTVMLTSRGSFKVIEYYATEAGNGLIVGSIKIKGGATIYGVLPAE